MFLALWGNYHYLLCSITAKIKTFKLALRRVTCLGTTEPQKHITWCIYCCTPSQLNAAQLRAAIPRASWASSAPLPSRSCWPIEGDLWAQAGKAGIGAGAHTREKNSSLTSTSQNAKLFNLVVLVVGFGGHISSVVLWQTYPSHCRDRRNTSREYSAMNSAMQRAGRDCCVVTLLHKFLHIIQ